jgi:hypothetical protein
VNACNRGAFRLRLDSGVPLRCTFPPADTQTEAYWSHPLAIIN